MIQKLAAIDHPDALPLQTSLKTLVSSHRHALHARLEEKLILTAHMEWLLLRWTAALTDDGLAPGGMPVPQRPPATLAEADPCSVY